LRYKWQRFGGIKVGTMFESPETFRTLLLLCICLVAVAVIAVKSPTWFRTKRQREEEAKYQAEQKEALSKAVERGTHDEQGYPLCRCCADKDDPRTRATEFGFRIDRDESVVGWIRQRIGAPARLKVGRRVDEPPMYCRACAPLCASAAQSYLLGFEQRRLDEVRDDDVAHRRFDLVGLEEQVKALIKKHDDEVKLAQRTKGADVVRLPRVGNGT
jgi:hypothetical protein